MKWIKLWYFRSPLGTIVHRKNKYSSNYFRCFAFMLNMVPGNIFCQILHTTQHFNWVLLKSILFYGANEIKMPQKSSIFGHPGTTVQSASFVQQWHTEDHAEDVGQREIWYGISNQSYSRLHFPPIIISTAKELVFVSHGILPVWIIIFLIGGRFSHIQVNANWLWKSTTTTFVWTKELMDILLELAWPQCHPPPSLWGC